MRVLACDLSSTSGFAFDGPDGKPQFSTLTQKMPFGMDAPGWGRFFYGLSKHMRDLIVWIGKDNAPEIIVCESPWVPIPRPGDDSRKTAQTAGPHVVFGLCGLAAVSFAIAEGHGMANLQQPASTARKFFTGSGRSPKGGEDIKKIVERRCFLLGWNPKNNHEADAACLWAYQKHLSDRSFVLPPPGALFAANRMRITA